jgi:hypothetical protein
LVTAAQNCSGTLIGILGSVGGIAQGLLGGGINSSINKMFKSDPGIF